MGQKDSQWAGMQLPTENSSSPCTPAPEDLQTTPQLFLFPMVASTLKADAGEISRDVTPTYWV